MRIEKELIVNTIAKFHTRAFAKKKKDAIWTTHVNKKVFKIPFLTYLSRFSLFWKKYAINDIIIPNVKVRNTKRFNEFPIYSTVFALDADIVDRSTVTNMSITP